MRANAGIFIFISLLFLVGTVVAYIPDKIAFTSNPEWVIANGVDQSTIMVTITNQSNNLLLSSSTVNFNVVDSLLGTMNSISVKTNSNGVATSNFKVKTKSGNATINVYVTNGTDTNTFTIYQKIDHDSPYLVTFTHPLEGNVTQEVPFNISIIDRHGNPIDNLNPNETHTIGLHVHGPSPDNCSFVENNLHDIYTALDENGNLSANIKLTSKSGMNYVLIDPVGSIAEKLESIQAVANGEPYYLTGSISNGGILSANGVDKFTINYFLYDIHMNPLQNRSIWIRTNLTDELTPKLFTTNSLGQVQTTYGPKISVLTANITAVAAENSSVTNSLDAHFVRSNVASNLFLVVTPQTMASRDSDLLNKRQAMVVAILYDDTGIPVTTGKDVTFTISGISTAPNNGIPGPSFESGSEILTKTNTTDSNGNAILTFYPGSFIKEGQPGYVNGATGSCTISATSGTISAVPVLVEWKNFPYLSVVVNVTPRTVLVNGTIDVTIQVKGDGYNMTPGPISVMLDMDTTSNMNAVASGDKTNIGGNGLERFSNSKLAAKYFVDSLNSSSQVGLVTYGYYPNNQYWQLMTNVLYNHDLVIASIDSLINQGGLDVSIRQSIHNATTIIKTNPLRPANEVSAIITIGDSAWTNDADLPAMVQEAWTDNGIRIYSIQYVSVASSCSPNYNNKGEPTNYAAKLETLTKAAHGQYYCNSSIEDVMASFYKIKQNLSEIAGVNTSMNLDFEHPTVNNETTWSGSDVFDYVVVDNGMTSPDSRTTILWPNNTRSFEDQTGDWNDDFRLNFTIGTIRAKQTWETTFRLKVKQAGTIDLFGSVSNISYNDLPGNLHLPTTLITSLNNPPPGFQGGTLDVSNPSVTKSGNFTDYVPLEWNLKYEGFNTTTEMLCYCVGESCTDIRGCPNGPWVLFDTRANIAPGYYTPHNGQLDVRNLPMDSYWVRVHAFAPDAPDDEETFGPVMVGYTGVFIKLT